MGATSGSPSRYGSVLRCKPNPTARLGGMMAANRDAYRTENQAKWRSAIGQALGDRPPISATWTALPDIMAILGPFAATGCNHALLPTGGGMDITGVARSREEGCIELVVSPRVAYLVRPARLTIEFFPNSPIESFLLLELGQLPPTGVYERRSRDSEELVELPSGDYLNRSHWDERILGYDDGGYPIPLPEEARLIVRWFSGKVLVVSKASIWNSVPETYDGRHTRMAAAEIRSQIDEVLTKLGTLPAV